jgi:hypothetical protein
MKSLKELGKRKPKPSSKEKVKNGSYKKKRNRAKTEEGSGYGIMSNDFPEKF